MVVITVSGEKDLKVTRVLTIYSKLIQGESINKKEMAQWFRVSEKTIQRDFDDIRAYFSDNIELIGAKDIVYNRQKNSYGLTSLDDILTKEDTLAVAKILLESRAFCKEELKHLTNSILMLVDISQRKYIKELIGNELLNYAPLSHGKLLLYKIWDLSELIRNKEVIQITYVKTDGSEVERKINPVATIFSEYYFYLIAYFSKFDSPIVFRIDRIKDYKSLGKKYYIANSERFEDGEFRKRVQFMHPGKLMKIKFEFSGPSIEAVMDRLPTARIIDYLEKKVVIEAEVYGHGIIMWILSQGRNIKVLEPIELLNEIREEIWAMYSNNK